MNKSLIFAALLVAPTMFAAPGERPSPSQSPIPTAMQGLVGVARQASPTPQNWDQTFAMLFRLVELDPANANLVQALVEQTILPSLQVARDGMLAAHVAASSAGDIEQVATLSKQMDKIGEGMGLLEQLLPLALTQLQRQRPPTPVQMIKPLAYNPAKDK